MKKAYLGIDIGSISTKGVIIDEGKNILAGIYLWTEGNPMGAAKKVIAALGEKIDQNEYKVVAAGTTGSARKLVGAMCNASIVKNEITAHAVGTTTLHPDVRTILEIGGQDSKIICVENGVAVDYAMNTLCAAGTGSFLSSQARRLGVEVEDFGKIALGCGIEKPFSFDVADMEFVTREVVCPNCANHCEIICVYRDGELIDSWGNRCERGEIKQGQD